MNWVNESKYLQHRFDEVVEMNAYTAWEDGGDIIRVKRADGSRGSLSLSFYHVLGTDYWIVKDYNTQTIDIMQEDRKGNESVCDRYMPVVGFSSVSAETIFDETLPEGFMEELIYNLDSLK
jgi:hypothetical protein